MRSLSIAVKPLLTSLLLFIPMCTLKAQEDDPELREQFLRGVAKTGQQIEQQLEQLSFRAKCETTSQLAAVSDTWKTKHEAKYAERQKDPHKVQIKKFEMAIRGDLGLATGVRKNGNTYFQVRNSAYAFTLERSPDGEWPSLQFVEQLGIDPAIDAKIAKLEGPRRAMAQAGFYLWGKPLFLRIKNDSFTIKRVYTVPSEAGELVGVEFEYLMDSTPETKFRVTDGLLICDPARQWIMTEYRGTFFRYINEEIYVRHRVVEVGEPIDGIPIATKVLETMSWPNDPGTSYEFVSTIEVTGYDVPEEEFYLTFYGLPEPNFRQTWLGKWGWYLAGGIACIVLGVIIKWRRA